MAKKKTKKDYGVIWSAAVDLPMHRSKTSLVKLESHVIKSETAKTITLVGRASGYGFRKRISKVDPIRPVYRTRETALAAFILRRSDDIEAMASEITESIQQLDAARELHSKLLRKELGDE